MLLMKSFSVSLSLERLRLCTSLCLRSSVLEPDLDLGIRQLQLPGHLLPLLHAEVGPLLVLDLQFGQLLAGEGSPGLPVRFVFPQRTL